MTRITFPYLLCITLVTLQSGTLNAHRKFAAAAFAPVLLNVIMMLFLAVGWLFPDAGIAASVGVTVSGVAQLALMFAAARRAGVIERIVRPRLGADVRQFFRALGPAVIGSAGPQIAIFADTIISSMLPAGGVSSIYYADRIFQLPIGVIGVAAGTVLLPEMSRYFAAGNPAAALRAQNRTMALTLALAAPFFIAFVLMPDEIMRGVFLRGKFTAEAASASGAVLSAYAFGLMPFLLISLGSLGLSGARQHDRADGGFAARRGVQPDAEAHALPPLRRGRARGRHRRRRLGQPADPVLHRLAAGCRPARRHAGPRRPGGRRGRAGARRLRPRGRRADRRPHGRRTLRRHTHLGIVGSGGAVLYGVALAGALKVCGVALPLRAASRPICQRPRLLGQGVEHAGPGAGALVERRQLVFLVRRMDAVVVEREADHQRVHLEVLLEGARRSGSSRPSPPARAPCPIRRAAPGAPGSAPPTRTAAAAPGSRHAG